MEIQRLCSVSAEAALQDRSWSITDIKGMFVDAVASGSLQGHQIVSYSWFQGEPWPVAHVVNDISGVATYYRMDAETGTTEQVVVIVA